MTVEEAVTDRLAGNAGVIALVGARVYQLKLPQRPTLPAVLVQIISEPGEYHIRGDVDLTRARVQIDCYGAEVGPDPYDAVSDVAAAVNTALSGGAPFTIGDRRITGAFRLTRRAMFEGGELKLIRVSQDFSVFSKRV